MVLNNWSLSLECINSREIGTISAGLFSMEKLSSKAEERQLVDSVKSGDAAAFERLYRLNIGFLSALCLRYVADEEAAKDVLQNAMLKIYSSIGSFKYKGDGSLRAWMGKIVLNDSLKYLKSKGRMVFQEIDDDYPQPTEENMEEIPANVLFDMIRSLPVGYRTVFNLFVIEGKSYKDIAKSLNIKEGTVASQIYKAKALLSNKIKEYERQMVG